ncbi:MAG: RNA polymerase sigma factor [Thermoleophilia bacterium]
MEPYVMPIEEGGVAIGGWPDERQGARKARRERFDALVRSHDRQLRALAFRLLGDRDLMDDALQEAYLRAYKALPSFRQDAAAATWLYRITYNVCLDRLRERRKNALRFGGVVSLQEMAEHGLEPPSPDDPATRAEHKDDLGSALADLTPTNRAAVLLVDVMGYDYSTAAGILGLKEGTIASRLHTARALLRGALSARHEEGQR